MSGSKKFHQRLNSLVTTQSKGLVFYFSMDADYKQAKILRIIIDTIIDTTEIN